MRKKPAEIGLDPWVVFRIDEAGDWKVARRRSVPGRAAILPCTGEMGDAIQTAREANREALRSKHWAIRIAETNLSVIPASVVRNTIDLTGSAPAIAIELTTPIVIKDCRILDEVADFPEEKHDDRVDAMARTFHEADRKPAFPWRQAREAAMAFGLALAIAAAVTGILLLARG